MSGRPSSPHVLRVSSGDYNTESQSQRKDPNWITTGDERRAIEHEDSQLMLDYANQTLTELEPEEHERLLERIVRILNQYNIPVPEILTRPRAARFGLPGLIFDQLKTAVSVADINFTIYVLNLALTESIEEAKADALTGSMDNFNKIKGNIKSIMNGFYILTTRAPDGIIKAFVSARKAGGEKARVVVNALPDIADNILGQGLNLSAVKLAQIVTLIKNATNYVAILRALTGICYKIGETAANLIIVPISTLTAQLGELAKTGITYTTTSYFEMGPLSFALYLSCLCAISGVAALAPYTERSKYVTEITRLIKTVTEKVGGEGVKIRNFLKNMQTMVVAKKDQFETIAALVLRLGLIIDSSLTGISNTAHWLIISEVTLRILKNIGNKARAPFEDVYGALGNNFKQAFGIDLSSDVSFKDQLVTAVRVFFNADIMEDDMLALTGGDTPLLPPDFFTGAGASSGGGRRNTRNTRRNTRNKRKKNRGTTKKRRRKSK
jgi:hypothetical protein